MSKKLKKHQRGERRMNANEETANTNAPVQETETHDTPETAVNAEALSQTLESGAGQNDEGRVPAAGEDVISETATAQNPGPGAQDDLPGAQAEEPSASAPTSETPGPEPGAQPDEPTSDEPTPDAVDAKVDSEHAESVATASENVAEATTVVESLPESSSPAIAEALADLLQQIADLKAQVAGRATVRTAARGTSHQARPNVTYKLLKKQPNWSCAPQVSQIVTILSSKFELGKDVPEPELFAAIEEGAKNGTLRTKQSPVRIFQYYRKDLIDAKVLEQR